MDKQTSEINGPLPMLRAHTVFLYLGGIGRVSRSSRMQWFLDHLDSIVTIPQLDTIESITKNIEILSIVPESGNTWTPDTAHSFQYYIHSKTKVVFLSRRYCLTFCLDMSPSMSTVDISHGDVLLDRVFISLKTCLEGVSRTFVLPGSPLVFYPEIFVSVIVNTPFFTTPAQQVLVQSWKVTEQNLQELCKAVYDGMSRLEAAVAEVAFSPNQPMVAPDQGFINMLRFGILALRLLPTASVSGMVVITDGVVAFPDTWRLDATLSRLRGTGISCHFVDVSSKFHAHVAQGRIPYSDLMAFLSFASQAACLSDLKETSILDFRDLQMNYFHKAFLAWSFQDLSGPQGDVIPSQEVLRKKQVEENLAISLMKILCCRIREGYVVTSVNLFDGQVEVVLQLPWKHCISIEYQVVSKWPAQGNKIHYTVHVLAPYDFLHDISCSKIRFESAYRQSVVNRFWFTMKNLAQSDYFLVHLHSKESNPSWNAIPESVRSGMPLFYMSNGGSLTSNDVSSPQFASFWKQVSLLDADIWEKWVHVSRVALLLKHDSPLPKHLHLRNASGRFQPVQCRQSQAALHSLLTEISSFVLVDGHSYVKIDGGTFCILRVTGRAPCVVLHVAWPCGVGEARRAETAAHVRKYVSELSCPYRSSGPPRISRTNSRVSSCLMLRKPVDKILVRYERAPATFETVIFPDGTQPCVNANRGTERSSYLVTTLSRYLHHQRWIYETTIGAEAIARILSTLTKARLQEGFAFAHSQAGVVNMLHEAEACTEGGVAEEDSATAPPRCVIQYVLFPPHARLHEDDDGPHCLVVETWVEPHSGLLGGLPYHRVGEAIAAGDSVIISALFTFEHLALMSRDRGIIVPEPRVNIWQEDEDARIRHVPFVFDVLSLLPHCRQAELLFSMPIHDWQMPGSKTIDSNTSLFELIAEQLGKLHDRELPLSGSEASAFLKHLFSRERAPDMKPLPLSPSQSPTTPLWKMFVKAHDPLHLTLTVAPASYADLKILASEMQEDTFHDFVHAEPNTGADEHHGAMHGRSVSVEPQQSLDSWSDGGSSTCTYNIINNNHSTLNASKPSLEDMLQTSLESLIAQPTETRQQYKPFRLRASSLDTNLEQARRTASVRSGAAWDAATSGGKRAASVRDAPPDVHPPPPLIQAPMCWPSTTTTNNSHHDEPAKPFQTIPLPIFVYDCPWQHLVDALLFQQAPAAAAITVHQW